MLCEACDEQLAPGALTCPKCGKMTAWGREARLEPYLRGGMLVVGVILLVVIGVLLKTHGLSVPHA